MGTALPSLVSHPGFRADATIRTAYLVVATAATTDPTPLPAAVAVLRVGADFSLQSLTSLDAPHFRPRQIAEKFWLGLSLYGRAKLVTFRGRQHDLPALELAAFRFALPLGDYVQNSRNRFNGPIDLHDWFTNHGANAVSADLSALAALLGRPALPRPTDIHDACLCDALDTYFVFLRTRVMACEITPDQEGELIRTARELIATRVADCPVLGRYVEAA